MYLVFEKTTSIGLIAGIEKLIKKLNFRYWLCTAQVTMTKVLFSKFVKHRNVSVRSIGIVGK